MIKLPFCFIFLLGFMGFAAQTQPIYQPPSAGTNSRWVSPVF